MSSTIRTHSRLRSLSGLIGSIQFAVASAVAMFFYGGGTPWHAEAQGYTFFYNFFSDLGRQVSLSGTANSVSAALFNNSLIVYGILLLIFYFTLPLLYPRHGWFRYSLTFFGAISAAGMILIGATPTDIRPTAHTIGVMLWIIPLVCVLIVTIRGDIKTPHVNRGMIFFSSGLVLIAVIHIIEGFAGIWHPIVPITQKIVVYYNIVWYAVMSLRLTKLARLHSRLGR